MDRACRYYHCRALFGGANECVLKSDETRHQFEAGDWSYQPVCGGIAARFFDAVRLTIRAGQFVRVRESSNPRVASEDNPSAES
jgi:hypothetical protein